MDAGGLRPLGIVKGEAVARKRLSDLFKRCAAVRLEDGEDFEVVQVCKLNASDMDEARKAADAARARVLTIKRHPESDDYMAVYGEIVEATEDELLDRLVADRRIELEPVLEAELGAEEEWSKDGYLEGLRDAWDEGLSDKYQTEERDDECERVFADLERFGEMVAASLDAQLASHRGELADLSRDKLEDRVLDSVLDSRANLAWLTEYRWTELYLATRVDGDLRTRYFQNKQELRELELEAVAPLANALREISVDVMEGKDSQEDTSS